MPFCFWDDGLIFHDAFPSSCARIDQSLASTNEWMNQGARHARPGGVARLRVCGDALSHGRLPLLRRRGRRLRKGRGLRGGRPAPPRRRLRASSLSITRSSLCLCLRRRRRRRRRRRSGCAWWEILRRAVPRGAAERGCGAGRHEREPHGAQRTRTGEAPPDSPAKERPRSQQSTR